MKVLRSFYIKFLFIKKNQDKFSYEFIVKVKKIFFAHYFLMLDKSDFDEWDSFNIAKEEGTLFENMVYNSSSVYLEKSIKNIQYLDDCESDLSKLMDSLVELEPERLFLDALLSQSAMDMSNNLGVSLVFENKAFYVREISKIFIETNLSFFSKWTSNQSSILNCYSGAWGGVFLELKGQIQDWIQREKNMNLSFKEINDKFFLLFKKACSLNGYVFLNEMPAWVQRDFKECLLFLKEIGVNELDINQEILSFSQVETDTSLYVVKNKIDYNKFKDYDPNRIISLFLNVYSYYLNTGIGKAQSLEFCFPVYCGTMRWLDVLNEVYVSVIRCVLENESFDQSDLYRIFLRGVSKIRSLVGGENSRLANSLAVLSDICCANQSYFCQLYRPSISVFPFLLNNPSSSLKIDFNIESHLISIARGSILKYLSIVSNRILKSTNPIKFKSAEFLNFALYELEGLSSSWERLKFFCDRYQFEMNEDVLKSHPLNRALFYLNQIFEAMQEKFSFISDLDIYSQGEFGVMKQKILDQVREFSCVECV